MGLLSWMASAWPTQPSPRRTDATAPRASSYHRAGADLTPMGMEWALRTAASVNTILRADQPRLVRLARDLCRNDPHATRFLELLSDNVAGPHGVTFQSKVVLPAQARDDGAEYDAAAIRAVEAAWNEWTRRENASVSRRSSFRDLQRQVVEGYGRDGEALVRIWEGWAGNPFGFAVQILDPDLLDFEYNTRHAPGTGNRVTMGVETNEWDQVVAFHMWRNHPDDADFRGERVRISADRILHIYKEGRPGQLRGLPRLASVLVEAQMLGGYREAAVTNARVGASKGGWFRPNPEVAGAVLMDDADDEPPAEAIEVEPGMFGVLPVGWDLVEWSPNFPNTSHEGFEKAMLRAIAAGLGPSYASLTGDLSDTNYSSMRKGEVQERDLYRGLQELLLEQFVLPIFPRWLRWALTMGRIPGYDIRDREYLSPHRFQPRGWMWVDPMKEMEAAEREVALGINSRTRLAAERGRDFADLVDELARERALAADRGISVDGIRRASAPEPSADFTD